VLGEAADALFEGVHRGLGCQILGDGVLAGLIGVRVEGDPLELLAEFRGVDVEHVKNCGRDVDELDEVIDLLVLEGAAVDEQRDVQERVVEAVLGSTYSSITSVCVIDVAVKR